MRNRRKAEYRKELIKLTLIFLIGGFIISYLYGKYIGFYDNKEQHIAFLMMGYAAAACFVGVRKLIDFLLDHPLFTTSTIVIVILFPLFLLFISFSFAISMMYGLIITAPIFLYNLFMLIVD